MLGDDIQAGRLPDDRGVRLPFTARGSMEAPRSSPIVRALAAQARRLTGRDAVFSGMSGWLDSALLDGAGIPTVVLGPSGAGLHGVEEWVDLDSVQVCRDIILGTIAEFCA